MTVGLSSMPSIVLKHSEQYMVLYQLSTLLSLKHFFH